MAKSKEVIVSPPEELGRFMSKHPGSKFKIVGEGNLSAVVTQYRRVRNTIEVTIVMKEEQ